ncbi:hypothetical protein GOP47_0011391 [Adiantum capillus-veneris]|uniref:Cyclin-like domain-containing protein n=1 Tax=Adiantum capillus-veneris TaxID=13818 RepID=A0A9D4USP7_ADICA|nr:hypothetical protein GOP47_0011391 [Adiantum capillus-veneris]
MSELLEGEADSWQGRAALEEPDHSSSQWYFPREHIESTSPSRLDGIDVAKEAYLRKSYCTFLQDLGMHLKVPQITIATAIVFCHRFFLRQSHARNDRYVIATVCMFLAGKVEETPKLLQYVISAAWEIRHKKDSNMVQRIKAKEIYEQEKELVLIGERLVLATLGFDLNIHHPYKPLVTAIKKLKVAQNSLAQVAWNFVNDGLRTSLCLQFKAHHIAAGAIFLAAKFLKVKLPSNDKRPWWQEFDVSPRQLEEVSNQMLELYEQHRELPASRAADSSATRASAIPPGTPQVAEKRPVVESKARIAIEPAQNAHLDSSKVVCTDVEQENMDKLKTLAEKRRKFKAEGGGMRSKSELTAEEELLERGMESGNTALQSDFSVHAHGHLRETLHYASHVHAGDTKYMKKDQVTEGNSMTNFAETKHRHLHNREHSRASQHHRVDSEGDNHRRPKLKDWQERESKRIRYEHAT